MKKEFININIDDNNTIINPNEIIEFINSIQDNINYREWTISTYNYLKSNRDIKNKKNVIEALVNKINEFGAEIDDKGNFNDQVINFIDEEEKIITEKNEITLSIPEDYDAVDIIEDNYMEMFYYIRDKIMFKQTTDTSDYFTLFSCLKTMIELIPEKGSNSIEYKWAETILSKFKDKYNNDSTSLNGFIRGAIERFNEHSNNLDDNTIDNNYEQIESHDEKRLYLSNIDKAACFAVLAEVGVLGFIILKFIG